MLTSAAMPISLPQISADVEKHLIISSVHIASDNDSDDESCASDDTERRLEKVNMEYLGKVDDMLQLLETDDDDFSDSNVPKNLFLRKGVDRKKGPMNDSFVSCIKRVEGAAESLAEIEAPQNQTQDGKGIDRNWLRQYKRSPGLLLGRLEISLKEATS